jgi:hypothetical protein
MLNMTLRVKALHIVLEYQQDIDDSIPFDIDRFAGLVRPVWPCRMLAGDCQDQASFVCCGLISPFLFLFVSSSSSRLRSLVLDRPIDSVFSLLLFASCVRTAVDTVRYIARSRHRIKENQNIRSKNIKISGSREG